MTECYQLDILDTAGQEEFSSMQEQWMRDGKGFMLVYNIINRATFDEVLKLREKIIRTKAEDVNTPMYVHSTARHSTALEWTGPLTD